MKKILTLSLLLNTVLCINPGHSSKEKCSPEYVESVLQKGNLSKYGSFISHDNKKEYELWVNEKKINLHDKGIESNLNSVVKENISTKWHPSNNKLDNSDEYCEVNIITKVKLFPYVY